MYQFSGGADGGFPRGELVLRGNTLLGTTSASDGSYGTLFSLNMDGTGFTVLHSFNGPDGASPQGTMAFGGSVLFGTTRLGGSTWGTGTNGLGYGAILAIDAPQTGPVTLSTLHSFTGGQDGANPECGLILAGTTLYGTASFGGNYGSGPGFLGGNYGNGTIFRVETNGTGFSVLHRFSDVGGTSVNRTNSDGAVPRAGLVLSGSTLYGVTTYGGKFGNGIVFAVETNGTAFRTLHHFLAFSGVGQGVNTDGAQAHARLIIVGKRLYGTTTYGGPRGDGTVFSLRTDGTDFRINHTFNGTDGAMPQAALVVGENALYGAAFLGGSHSNGTLFSLPIQPELSIVRLGQEVILTWPTNAIGYNVQISTSLGSQTSWMPASSSPTVINGENNLTQPLEGPRQFFRLSK